MDRHFLFTQSSVAVLLLVIVLTILYSTVQIT